jgi:hypothetical protein
VPRDWVFTGDSYHEAVFVIGVVEAELVVVDDRCVEGLDWSGKMKLLAKSHCHSTKFTQPRTGAMEASRLTISEPV